ncbi:MAG: polyprenyl synthetase family protein [Bacteroidota bacterium]
MTNRSNYPERTVDLKTITRPIKRELQTFQSYYKKSMRSRVALVDIVARYVAKQKGKRIRPILVLLSASVTEKINERTYRAAVLVEFLHTATLIHDDVVDDADTRRGLASVNAIWKNKVSVLMGDYLLARGLLLSLDHDDFQFLKIVSTAVKRMSEGEILQIQKSRQLDIDEKTYFKIISDKTASLVSTCCELGAASVTESEEIRHRMREFGENIGIAFQIRDDLLDYIGRRSITGKPTGLDMTEKKLTLPLIHSLHNAPRSEARNMIRTIKNGKSKKELKMVVQFAQDYGGIEYAVGQARRYARLAAEQLESLPESPGKQALRDFVEFVVSRTK